MSATMRYWFIGVLLTLTTFIVGCAYFWQEKSTDQPIPQKEYVVGVLYDYKPFSYLDAQGVRVGFDLDVAHAMCNHLQLSCKFVSMPFHKLMEGARAKEIDILVAGAWATDERKKDLAFSDTYYRSRSFFITSLPNVHDVTPETAPQLIIGTISGTIFVNQLQTDFGAFGAQVKAYQTHAELVQAIRHGDINTLLINGLPGYALLKSPEGRNLYIAGWYNQLPEVLTESKIAVRHDNDFLIPKINDFLLHIQAAGRYQELSLKYFPFMNY